MNELIKITEQNGKQAVSARELHAFLGAKKDFSNWIKDRIKRYGLIENQDYVVFADFGENPNGGRPLTEYALTLDTAKELAMVEGNAKGKQARQYFIACENKLKEVAKPQLDFSNPTTVLQLAQNWAEEQQKRLEAENKIETQKQQIQMLEGATEIQQEQIKNLAPKAQYTDEVLQSTSTFTLTQIAHDLGLRSVHVLTKTLKEKGILYYQSGQWQPTAKVANKGYFDTRTAKYVKSDNTIGTSLSTVITEKGRQFIHGVIRTAV